jgi:arginyl-tRNA synthetase
MPAVSAPQHLFTTMLARVRGACASALGAQVDLARVVVEPPRDPTHGDMATNAAMVLAKDAGKKPRELAEAIAAVLRADDHVAKVDVAGPGFINLTLKPHVWGEELRVVLESGADYGRSTMGQNDLGYGEKVNVEYVSANPTGPMHVGHGRGAVFGDALASLLAFSGCEVTREYNINDAGAQTCWRARRTCVIAKRSAKTSARSRTGFIPATIWCRSAPRSPPNTGPSSRRCRKPTGCRWCAARPSP